MLLSNLNEIDGLHLLRPNIIPYFPLDFSCQLSFSQHLSTSFCKHLHIHQISIKWKKKKNVNMQNKTKPLNTSLLSFIQFIGAILVIALHCRRLFEADQFHFIQKSIFSRMVVPYFMVTASFFLRRNYPSLSKQYPIRYSKQYLTWSILYLPFYLIYLTLQKSPSPTIPSHS